MAIPYGDTQMLIPQKTGIVHHYPFIEQGDSVTKITEEEWVVHRDGYAPGFVGDVHPDDPDSYLIKESKPIKLDGGLIQYKKTWSMVPQTRLEYDSFVFVTPILSSISSPTLVNNSALSNYVFSIEFTNNNTGLLEWGRRIQFDAADQPHGINDGDIVRLEISYNRSGIPSQTGLILYLLAEVHATDGSTYIDIYDYLTPLWDTPNQYGEVVEKVYTGTYVDSTGEAKVVTSEIQLDYFLAEDPSSIQRFDSLTFYDSNNERTNTLDANSTPTADEYAAWVANGVQIIAEPSKIKRWKGNIWERSTKYITATV